MGNADEVGKPYCFKFADSHSGMDHHATVGVFGEREEDIRSGLSFIVTKTELTVKW
jgi:hypothetical protein